MKKVISILMMVVVMMSIITANADHIGVSTTWGQAHDYMEEWCKTYGYESYLNEEGELDEDGYIRYVGLLPGYSWERQVGLEATVENYMKWSIEEFGVNEYEIRQVGEIEGRDIYWIQATSEDHDLCYGGYKKVRVLVMVYFNDAEK